ncbi:MAG: c-type cytochrome, partial [Acidobacteriota bacterium]
EVRMLTAGNKVEKIPASKVKSLKIQKGSRMPEDYSSFLTFDQMADLIAYLQSLKGDKTEAAAK